MAELIIHQDKIPDNQELIKLCPFGAMEEKDGKVTISAACKMCRLCVRKGPKGAVEYVEDAVKPSVDKSAWKGIAVYVDHVDGKVHPVTLELLGKARELSKVTGHPVYALFMGNGIDAAAHELLHYNVDKVFVYDAPELARFQIEPYTAVFENFIQTVKPSSILVGATTVGRQLAPRVAARMKTGLTADCTILEMDENTDLSQIRPAFGGNIMAHIKTPNHRPQMATVRYKIMNAPERAEKESGEIVVCTIEKEKLLSHVRVLDIVEKPKETFIENADVLVGENINEEYSHDELSGTSSYPDVVVKAKSAEEIAAIMKYAYENTIPVTPRGAGTGLVGSSVPMEHGIMIDTTLMNQILELDEENLTVTVEPGVLLMELSAYVEDHDFFYPPDPGEKSATIGGNISTNAGGMRAVKYGVTRDYVMGLEVVLPDGTITQFGGKVVKNSSGYDLKDLIIGSEGTLGFITKAILKLLPLPKRVISLLIPFPTLKQAIDTVPVIIKSKTIPTAIEFMQREVIEDAEEYLGKAFPDKQSDAYLLLKFDGNSTEEIEEAYDKVAKLCLEQGALDVLISDTQEREESIWKARGAFLEAIKGSTTYMDEVDMVVPRSRVNEMVTYLHDLHNEIDIRIKSFGHAGDGNLHAYILKDDLSDEEWEKRMSAAMEKIYQKAHELEGQVSGEHGIGYAKKPYLRESLPEKNLDLMNGIKKVFDPKNILNPHKVAQR